MTSRRWVPRSPTLLVLRLTGTGLLVASGAIHLDLYLTGYRTIPTIGWMFLLQAITAFLLAAALGLTGSWFVAAMGAGFAASTLVGYLLSVWIGLFGFKEVRTTAGLVAGVIDVAAVAALSAYVVTELDGSAAPSAPAPRSRVAGIHVDARKGAIAVFVTSLACVALFGISAAVAIGTPSLSTAGSVELSSMVLGGKTILTDARGFTLYWFALDTPSRSHCTGSCTAYWPPITGRPRTVAHVAGSFGTIERGGGVTQATFDGHPLYRFIGDSAPGQTHGNGLNLSGGVWHDVTVPL
jgi:predicted lipoprotein with Yx(FWY)xxD motif